MTKIKKPEVVNERFVERFEDHSDKIFRALKRSNEYLKAAHKGDVTLAINDASLTPAEKAQKAKTELVALENTLQSLVRQELDKGNFSLGIVRGPTGNPKKPMGEVRMDKVVLKAHDAIQSLRVQHYNWFGTRTLRKAKNSIVSAGRRLKVGERSITHMAKNAVVKTAKIAAVGGAVAAGMYFFLPGVWNSLTAAGASAIASVTPYMQKMGLG
jgi:hypothetical protein